MRATFRPLPAWPYAERPKATVPFRSGWEETLDKLELEIRMKGGSDVVIGVVCDESQVSMSGSLKAGSRTAVRHPGVEVSFELETGQRLIFHTDAYATLTHNLRAVAMGLEALRGVDRYGITSGSEQYAGFAQLTAGGPDQDRGRRLVESHGTIAKALKATHPDHGGDSQQFADVQAYRTAVGASAR
jgi:hypothetical protein